MTPQEIQRRAENFARNANIATTASLIPICHERDPAAESVQLLLASLGKTVEVYSQILMVRVRQGGDTIHEDAPTPFVDETPTVDQRVDALYAALTARIAAIEARIEAVERRP